MDPITQQTVLAAAGAAGADPLYVDDVFSTFLYEGNGTARSINNGIDLAGEGGLVWIKNRDNGYQDHVLNDTERGAGQTLRSDSPNGQFLSTARFSAFNSNGFSVGTDSGTNNNNEDIVSWTFRKAPGFFDVVTYPGDSDPSRTISHNLGSTPGMIIIKCTSESNRDWVVYHRSLGFTQYTRLNEPSQPFSVGTRISAADASTFTPGQNNDTNATGKTYVAYLFAHDDAQYGTDADESIIKCGSYSGNSAANSIDVGFEPQWLLIKSTYDEDSNWQMFDIMRGAANNNIDQPRLEANDPGQEVAAYRFNVTSTGFFTDQASTVINASGRTYIYMAIRRPNKPPEVGTDVFAIDTYTGSIPNYISGFPVDFVINRDGINGGGDVTVFSRLLGTKRLKTNSSETEGNAFVAAEMDYNNGYASGTGTSPDSEKYSWMFKRAPGFMDVVAYTGNGTAGHNISHNLGTEPEFIFLKARTYADSWVVYHKDKGNGYYAKLDADAAGWDNTTAWNSTTPTSTVFTVGAGWDLNRDTYTYIAYLFATLPDISKVGSYSGYTSNAVNVDCGFTAGARFILIKRTDSTGDWYVWDTTRGIVSGNDPYLLLNRDNNGTDAQVTNTDYIDPLTTGFTVTASAPAALNATGGTYLFLAIA